MCCLWNNWFDFISLYAVMKRLTLQRPCWCLAVTMEELIICLFRGKKQGTNWKWWAHRKNLSERSEDAHHISCSLMWFSILAVRSSLHKQPMNNEMFLIMQLFFKIRSLIRVFYKTVILYDPTSVEYKSDRFKMQV